MNAHALSTFDALESRHRITLTIVAVTAMRVGAGKAQDPAATDQPVMRDAMGRPFLPGSAVKGALRCGLEKVIRGLARDQREGLWSCDIFAAEGEHRRCTLAFEPVPGGVRKAPDLKEVCETLCTTCGLFGSSYFGGRVFVHDLPLVKNSMFRTEVRDGVGINRDLRTAQRAITYDTETVPPGTAFELELVLENVSSLQKALVMQALDMLDQGVVMLGGMTSRGLGRVRLEQRKMESTSASRLLSGQGFEAHDWDAEQQAAIATLEAVVATGTETDRTTTEVD